MALVAQEKITVDHLSGILSTVIDKAEFGSIILDETGFVVMWNQKMTLFSGIEADDALGKNLEQLFGSNLLGRFQNSIKQALTLGMSSVLSHKFHGAVLPLSNKDGGDLLFTTYIKPITIDPNNRNCLIEIHDITNVEAREKRLRKITQEQHDNETRLRLLTDNLPAVIHQVRILEDGTKKASYLSRGVEQLLSTDYDIVSDDPDFLRKKIVTDDVSLLDEVMADVIEHSAERDIIVRVNINEKVKKWVHMFLRGRDGRAGQKVVDGLYLDVTNVKVVEEELRRLATTDSLTGISNRRHLMDSSEREFSMAHRYATPLSVLLLDIDHFKSVNDSFGHAAGDAVLETFARTIKGVIRQTDKFGRYGGEEFVVTLPHSTCVNAMAIAEKIRKVIETMNCGRDNLSVTVSIGVSEMTSDDKTLDEVLKRADTAVYEAKNSGRNCIASN
ncbi:MAG: GGDEF domain-containing protein [Sneathiella sp.]